MNAKGRKSAPLPRLIARSVWPKATEGVLRYRFPILITLILLFATSVYGIFQLRADFSFETIFLSEDGARTFSKSQLVHAGPSAYSDMTVLPDGSVLIFYEGGTKHRYNSIRMARFNQDWLMQTK